jgi:hypothetical protein
MKFFLAFFGCLAIFLACSRPNDEGIVEPMNQLEIRPTPEPTKPPIPVHIAELTSSELCDRVGQIEVLPTRDPAITDPIYESLLLKGNEAVPCLIEKIGNNTLIKDPRYSVPTWHSYAVGDTAFFTLLDILSKGDYHEWENLLRESLPRKYREEWETNGIYAYFNYVLEPQNRREFQQWWKNWLKKNKK